MGARPLLKRRNLLRMTTTLIPLLIITGHYVNCSPQQEESSQDEQIIIIKDLPIFPKILSPPIFYTTFFPIIFEYKLPQWEQADLRIKWPSGHSTGCNSTESVSYYSQIGCPSVYHYNTVIGRFFDTTEKMAFGNVNQDVHNGFPTLPISCEEISSHFVGNSDPVPTTTSSPSFAISWDKYWKLLASCPVREFHKESVSSELAKLDLTKVDYMLQRFWDHYAISAYSHVSYVGGSVYTASYSALQSIGLIQHFVEMQRWSDSLSLCHAGILPRHLVGFSKLKQILNLVNGRIVKGKSYTTSISDLSAYYKLPLTDCARFSQNDSLVIRTLVPIRPGRSNFSLIDLQPITFTKNFNTSSSTNLVCGMHDMRGVYAVDSASGYVKGSDCKSGKLCFIKENDPHWVDPCLSSVFNMNTNNDGTDNKLSACRGKTTCQSVPTSKFPIFSRLSNNILAIVGYSAENIEIFVSCNGNPYKVIKPNETGVLLVQLSCSCKVVHKFEEFHAQEPCNSVMKIQHANFSSMENEASGSELNFEGVSGQITNKAYTNFPDQIEGEQICSAENWLWMLYLSIVLGLLGFISLIWNIIDAIMARKLGDGLSTSCKGENSEDASSNPFAGMAYRANRQGMNENPMAYLVQKEQNVL